MKLRYGASGLIGLTPAVLHKAPSVRVEFHLRQDQSGCVSLIAMSGNAEGLQPNKVKLQGPYETLPQAVAARNAIIYFLNTSGYSLRSKAPAIWELAAQRVIKETRLARNQSRVDTTFKPGDVFLDW